MINRFDDSMNDKKNIMEFSKAPRIKQTLESIEKKDRFSQKAVELRPFSKIDNDIQVVNEGIGEYEMQVSNMSSARHI